MKNSILIATLFILTPLAAQAFTLTSAGRGFDRSKINIHVAATECSGAGLSVEDLRHIAQDAAADYWNAVATSSLRLKVLPTGNLDIEGMTHKQILDSGMVEPHSILIGCNQAAFAPSSQTLGAAQMDCDGSVCRSVFILNARNDGQVGSLNRDEQISVVAHELGHAIGLGHTEISHNLMYYKIGGKTQRWLGQDDIDGVTYLYPHEPVGCEFLPLFGSMGSIDDAAKGDKQGSAGGPLSEGPLAAAMLGFALALLLGQALELVAKGLFRQRL